MGNDVRSTSNKIYNVDTDSYRQVMIEELSKIESDSADNPENTYKYYRVSKIIAGAEFPFGSAMFKARTFEGALLKIDGYIFDLHSKNLVKSTEGMILDGDYEKLVSKCGNSDIDIKDEKTIPVRMLITIYVVEMKEKGRGFDIEEVKSLIIHPSDIVKVHTILSKHVDSNIADIITNYAFPDTRADMIII